MNEQKLLWASTVEPTKDQLEELLDDTGNELIYLKDVAPYVLKQMSNVKLNTDTYALAMSLFDVAVANEVDVIVQPEGNSRLQRSYGIYTAVNASRPHKVSIVESYSEHSPEGELKHVTFL